MTLPPAPALSEPDAEALRADLTAWTVDAVEGLLGERATAALARERLVAACLVARRAGAEPLAVLTRVFILGEAVPRAWLDGALRSLGTDGAVRCGIVTAAGEGREDAVRATVDLRPYAAADGDDVATWWIASDQPESVRGGRLADDHVLGAGGASATLASLTVRRRVGRVLDLGTGSGIQALHASAHADTVVATDISTRALAFAAFNRELNAPPAPWELRRGSLLEPVAGEAFDLMVSNPPFVITPPGGPRFDYRDAGLGGDAVVRSLVEGVGGVLAPGGLAQLLGNWEIRRGEPWTAGPEAWLDAATSVGPALDAWIIQRDVLDAAEYAETWLRDAGIVPEREPGVFDAAYEAYLADFDARGVEAVGLGMITLRHSTTRPSTTSTPDGSATLRRLESHEGPLPSPIGPHVAAVLDVHDWLARRSDTDVLAQCWVAAEDVTIESYARPGAADPEHIIVRQGGGLGRAMKADTALAGFVGACDGELTGAQIAHAIAALLGEPAAPIATGLARAVRKLAMDGVVKRFDAE